MHHLQIDGSIDLPAAAGIGRRLLQQVGICICDTSSAKLARRLHLDLYVNLMHSNDIF